MAITVEVPFTRRYTSWAAVAGFFDGDGCLNVDPREYVLHWVISFSDNWLPQIEQLREFLIGKGIRVGKPRRVGTGAWGCEIAEIRSMLRTATKMLESGGIYKKRRELQLLIDYYSDKVTGTQVFDALNDEVRMGNRLGRIKHVDMPFSHAAGYARGRLASRFEQRALTEDEAQNLINDYNLSGATGKTLARKYNISEATVSRLLRRRGINRRSGKKTASGSPLDS